MSYWGYHSILNVAKCCPMSIRNPDNIIRFSNSLVKRIDMIPYEKPQLVMFGTGNKKGYTLIQLIETSNICAHFVEETNDMYLDVFSCKHFDSDVVKNTIEEYFSPHKIDEMFLTRQATQYYLKNGRVLPTQELK